MLFASHSSIRPRVPRGLRAWTTPPRSAGSWHLRDGRRAAVRTPRYPASQRADVDCCAATRPALIMAEKKVSVTLQVAGPMKRSTFQKEAPDPVEQAIQDLLHWCWSTRLQIGRLSRSIHGEFEAWGRGPRVRSRRAFSRTSYDKHLVYVAAANLQRALDAAPRALRSDVRMAKVPGRVLRLLRDVYEHWDQLRREFRKSDRPVRGAAGRLAKEFPGADPWSFTFELATDDIVFANVVVAKDLTRALRLLEARLLRCERHRQRGSS
jgi:hypothetical protein